MPVAPLPPSAPPPAAGASTGKPALLDAGQKFEAMMLERLLASARPPARGPEGDWRAMADRSVAETLARQSPLGIAALLEKTVK